MTTANTHLLQEDDWLQTLFLKRMQGRRIQPESQPPYQTAAGLVLVDRRSHKERRHLLGSPHADEEPIGN